MRWQVQDAKQKFSELVKRALADGPQVVTRHGTEVVIVLAATEYRRLTGQRPDFTTFLLTGPDLGQLDLTRPADLPRAVEL